MNSGTIGGIGIGRGNAVLGENLLRCHLIHRKSHMIWDGTGYVAVGRQVLILRHFLHHYRLWMETVSETSNIKSTFKLLIAQETLTDYDRFKPRPVLVFKRRCIRISGKPQDNRIFSQSLHFNTTITSRPVA
jgi:hypothetical protein